MEATLSPPIDDVAEIARGRLRNSPVRFLRTYCVLRLRKWRTCTAWTSDPVSTTSSWPRRRCDGWRASGKSSMRSKWLIELDKREGGENERLFRIIG